MNPQSGDNEMNGYQSSPGQNNRKEPEKKLETQQQSSGSGKYKVIKDNNAEQLFIQAKQQSRVTEQARKSRELRLMAQYNTALQMEEIERKNKLKLQEEERKRRIVEIRLEFEAQRERNKKVRQTRLQLPKQQYYAFPVQNEPKPLVPKRDIEKIKQNKAVFYGIRDGKVRPPSFLKQIQKTDVQNVTYEEFTKIVKQQISENILRSMFQLASVDDTIPLQTASKLLVILKNMPCKEQPKLEIIKQVKSSKISVFPRADAATVSTPSIQNAKAKEIQKQRSNVQESQKLQSKTPIRENTQQYQAVPQHAEAAPEHIVLAEKISNSQNLCINGIITQQRPISSQLVQSFNEIIIKVQGMLKSGMRECDMKLVLNEEQCQQIVNALLEYANIAQISLLPDLVHIYLRHDDYQQMLDCEIEYFRQLSNGVTLRPVRVLASVFARTSALFAARSHLFAWYLCRAGCRVTNLDEKTVIFMYQGKKYQIWLDPVELDQLRELIDDIQEVTVTEHAVFIAKGGLSCVQNALQEFNHQVVEAGVNIYYIEVKEAKSRPQSAVGTVKQAPSGRKAQDSSKNVEEAIILLADSREPAQEVEVSNSAHQAGDSEPGVPGVQDSGNQQTRGLREQVANSAVPPERPDERCENKDNQQLENILQIQQQFATPFDYELTDIVEYQAAKAQLFANLLAQRDLLNSDLQKCEALAEQQAEDVARAKQLNDEETVKELVQKQVEQRFGAEGQNDEQPPSQFDNEVVDGVVYTQKKQNSEYQQREECQNSANSAANASALQSGTSAKQPFQTEVFEDVKYK